MNGNPQYYGSDLNQFIDERCSHEMTCINIDCFMVKVAKRRIRFIESKHSKERMKKGQRTALLLLYDLTHPSYTVESFVVRGEYPYHRAKVEDIKTGESFDLSQEDLIAWLDFELELVETIQQSADIPLSEFV